MHDQVKRYIVDEGDSFKSGYADFSRPKGLAATVLMLLFSVALNFYVTNIGRYDQVYGRIGAVVVLMLWLYVTVLIGTEMNAVLARMAEERKGVELVQEEAPANETSA